MSSSSLVVTAAEMRALDQYVIEQLGVPSVVLMETAGRGVVRVIESLRPVSGLKVLVFIGPGNNGGDGWVVARVLRDHGADVLCVLCAPESKLSPDARVFFEVCKKSEVPILPATALPELEAFIDASGTWDVVVDALLGTGLDRPLVGHMNACIAACNQLGGLKIAVDIPSGLDADRGVPLGVAVRADHTVTFGFAKRGLVVSPGFTYAGELHLVDIGISEALAKNRGVSATLLGDDILAPLVRQDPLGHKGTHGDVAVVAGSRGKVGAALLCAKASLRSGAGLCTLVSPVEIEPFVAGKVPEVMTQCYAPSDDPASVVKKLHGKDGVVVGPGMPTDAYGKKLLAELLAWDDVPCLVIDADALNHLAMANELWRSQKNRARAILTPHPGEAARLLDEDVRTIQADRIGAAQRLAVRFSTVVALKGARTVVAAPDGRLAICPTGNPGLGSGGTGDVLAGCVAALSMVEEDPFTAACRAVYLHGRAADQVAHDHGDRGLLASDVIDALPRAMR